MNDVSKSRYLNIDALRGIAAFLVLLYHLIDVKTVFNNFLLLENFSIFSFIYIIPSYGYTGVYLFFVISGFCIHLRWAKAYSRGEENPKIDFIAFWKRRWVRLYPAYIAAIILYLALPYVQGKAVFHSLFLWDLIAHVLMIHNFDNRIVYSMNGIFWTLAIEEQLYLIYFLLLWMRRRYGWFWALTVCFAARFIWFGSILLLNKVTGFEVPINEGTLANWWIWALGAIAVENYLGIIKFPRWCYSLLLGFTCLLIGAYLRYEFLIGTSGSMMKVSWVFEPFFWGAGFFFLINRVMQYEGRIKLPVIAYITSICATVGLFSYSLYLTHEFFVQVFAGFSPIIIISLSLLFAYSFYLIFEKPFMLYLSRQKE